VRDQGSADCLARVGANGDTDMAARLLAVRGHACLNAPENSNRQLFPVLTFPKVRSGTVPGTRFINESLDEVEARPVGFEPTTLGSEDRCAIQLRHGRVA
jgi:hypothetical protein